jgi:hypothetical protein
MKHPIMIAAAVAALIVSGPPAAANAPGVPVDVELALGIDVSRSIDPDEARLQRDGYVAAFRSPRVHHAIKGGMLGRIAVAYYEWAGFEQRTVLNWMVIADAASAETLADILSRHEPMSGRRTGISGAIDYGAALFENNGIEGMRRVIDISADGPNNWGEPVTVARDRAVAKRITINGLPIMNDRPTMGGLPPMPNLDLYFRDCVIGGPRAFLVVAESFEDFARAVLRKLIMEIAGLDPVRDARHALLDGLPPSTVLAAGATTRIAQSGAVGGEMRAAPPCDAGERQRRRWWGEDVSP